MGVNSYEATVHKVGDDHGLDGIPVLEVYSITYLGSSPMEAKDQIGSISIKTNDMLYILYIETKEDPNKPSIKYGDKLPMRNVGPICSCTDPRLKFDNFSSNYRNPKDEVVVPFQKDGDCLKKLCMKSKDGCMRNISVLFGCFFNATVANLKVKYFPNATSEATTNVHGAVIASNSKFDHPSCTSYLFFDSTIQVVHHGVIPLSKSRVGVPLSSHLYVDISLFCDGLQYKGTAKFTPKINDKESQFVDEKILVEVTWKCNEDSDFTDEDSDFTDGDSDFTDEDLSSNDEFDSEREYDS